MRPRSRAAASFRAYWLGAEGERGQALVIMAGMMIVLMIAVGVAVNLGVLYSSRRTAQEAADAGAIAAATVIYQGGTTAQAIQAAKDDATTNGYTNGVSGATVTVNNPPLQGVYANNSAYYEVVITKSVLTPLLPAEGGYTSVTVRGVGGAEPAAAGYAIIALDRGNTSGAFTVGPQGSVILTGGGIEVNSSSATAAKNSGSISITPASKEVDVNGNVTGSFPNLHTGSPQGADPYAGYPKPSTSGLSALGCGGTALVPGLYSCTINGNNAYTMAAGTYIFAGGGISLAGNSSLNGTGVFIYLTNANYPAAGGACATLSLHGDNATAISPPTSGPYKGMLLYQDPVCTGTLSVGGNGSVTTSGTIYAPTATCAGNGNNAIDAAGQIVCFRIDVQNADFTVNFTTGSTATPTVPALVE